MRSIIHTINHKPLYIICSLLAISLPSTVFPLATHASPVTVSATIDPILQINLDTNIISLDLSPINSTTAFGTADLNVSVATNNQAGYNLALTAASTNLTRTIAASDNTYPTIPTLTSTVTTTAPTTDFPTNHWGYFVGSAPTDPTASVTYSPFTTVINFPSVTTPTNGANTTMNFAAKINDQQPAGTYELNLTFTAVARPTTQDFTVNYDSGVSAIAVKQNVNSCDPTLTTGETNACPLAGTITNSTATSGSGSVPGLGNGVTYYLVPTFTEGREFASWTNDQNSVGTLGTPDTNTGQVTYTIGDPITDTATNSVTLASKKILPTMQDFTLAMCQAQASSSPVTVVDKRDNQEYTVRYINDRCWMIKNIAIGCSSPEGSNEYGGTIKSIKLTSSDSNVSSDWPTTTASLTLGNDYSNPRMECNATYGGYYNYAAATAGTITSGSTEASYSICPKGWRLPSQSEFRGITGSSSTFSPVYSGYYNDGTLYTGSYGYWWSSTAGYNTYRYHLFYNGSLDATTTYYYDNRCSGYSVRCVRSS